MTSSVQLSPKPEQSLRSESYAFERPSPISPPLGTVQPYRPTPGDSQVYSISPEVNCKPEPTKSAASPVEVLSLTHITHIVSASAPPGEPLHFNGFPSSHPAAFWISASWLPLLLAHQEALRERALVFSFPLKLLPRSGH